MTKVRRLSSDEYGAWDAFVARSPQGSVYATSAYLAVLGFPFEIWVVDEGEIQAGIPLVRNEVGHLSNPLFAKYLGLLVRPLEGATPARASLFFRLADTLLTGLPTTATFDYTHHPSFENWLPYYWLGFRQESRYTYVQAGGDGTLDHVLGRCDAKLRSNIRKADKDGIGVVAECAPDALYRCVAATFQQQGGNPPFSRERLMRLVEGWQELGVWRVLAATDGSGVVQAVAGLVEDAGHRYLILNGTDRTVAHPHANALVVAHAVADAAAGGRALDFEGSMMAPIERFYRQYGGALTPFSAIWKPGLRVWSKRSAVKLYKKLRYGK